jgi:hypothetical protein
MPRMAVLASKGRKRDRVVLMTREYITKAHYPDASPFGLPLRVDIPNVDPSEWEDDDDDD